MPDKPTAHGLWNKQHTTMMYHSLAPDGHTIAGEVARKCEIHYVAVANHLRDSGDEFIYQSLEEL